MKFLLPLTVASTLIVWGFAYYGKKPATIPAPDQFLTEQACNNSEQYTITYRTCMSDDWAVSYNRQTGSRTQTTGCILAAEAVHCTTTRTPNPVYKVWLEHTIWLKQQPEK